MPHLSLCFLGPFQAMLDDRSLTGLASTKVRALLAYLAVESDRPHARETLAGMLWPDVPNSNALRNLRLALSNLRLVLGDRSASPSFLLISRETIQFNPASDHELDVAVWTQSTAIRDDAKERVAAVHGPFLDGFSCDSAPFEEWLRLRREQINRNVIYALRDLTAQCEAQGDYAGAQTFARRQLDIEPWDEAAHRQLMRALAAGGQTTAALAQYQACSRLLKQELGAEPSPETTALYESIRRGAFGSESRRVISNVPRPLTSFVGRQQEIAQVKHLLATTRLLSLTGSGGCGKTRLAIQVVSELVRKDGIAWVDLAGLNDPFLVPQVVGTTLGLRELPGASIESVLMNYLRMKELLLVLDNCEHLIEVCGGLIDSLLRACPKLQILVTSQQTLGIVGETIWRVPSLGVPSSQTGPERWTKEWQTYDALRLFSERARAVAPIWNYEENAMQVAQICIRLDGMPLAIELAAARLQVLSTDELARRLDNRFHLLTGGSRTALPRHQTLRATMDWSYELLPDLERVLLRRLSVFAGGFTLDAAEQVCADREHVEGQVSIEAGQVLDLLSQLITKSLVGIERQDGAARYTLLETIRQYAREKLVEATETEPVRNRHLAFFLRLAEETELKLDGADQGAWLNVLEQEYENLRAAIQWAEENGHSDAALRLVYALDGFWSMRCYFSEARQTLAAVLSMPQAHNPELAFWRARALWAAGGKAQLQSDFDAAQALLRDALAIFRELDDKWWIVRTLNLAALGDWMQAKYAEAYTIWEEALQLQQQLGDKAGLARQLKNLGLGLRELGNYDAARHRMEEALALQRELGDQAAIALSLMDAGATAHAQGDPAASALLFESIDVFRALGDKLNVGRCLHDLGAVAARQGDTDLARSRFTESLLLFRELGDRRNLIKCLEGLAGVALAESQPEKAAHLFGASEALRKRIGTPLPTSYRANYESTLSRLRGTLDEKRLEELWAEGRAMTMEQAIDQALVPLVNKPAIGNISKPVLDIE